MIRHARVSTVADDAGQPNLIQPSDWNADHTIDNPAAVRNALGLSYTVGAGFDGAGAPLTTTGTVRVLVGPVRFAGTITLSDVTLDQPGDCTIGVKKCPRATYPGALADITGGNDIVVAAAAQQEDAVLAGWTLVVAIGDIFELELKNVDGVIEQAIVLLKVSL
jgi:hypothetical protein